MAETKAANYQFGPLERRGLGGMLRPGQVVVLVATVAIGVGALSVLPTAAGAVFAFVAFLTGFVVGFVPVAGRTLEQWAGPWFHHHWGIATGRQAEVALGEAIGIRRSDGAMADAAPSVVAGVEMLSFVHEGRRIGVAKDGRRGGYTVAMRTTGPAFMLRDREEHEALLSSWGECLAQLTTEGSPLSRVQLLERTVPDTGHDLAEYFDEIRDPELGDDHPAIESYRQLLDGLAPASQRHETLLVARVEGGEGHGVLSAMGAGRVMALVLGAVASVCLAVVSIPAALIGVIGIVVLGALFYSRTVTDDLAEDRAACELLARELRGLERGLEAADIRIDEVLTPRAYAWAIRTACDPIADAERRPADDDPGVSPANMWPVAATGDWSWWQTDSGLHRTWRVREFPRRPVAPDWLAPLLLETNCRRTVAFVLQPISALKALREAERAVTSDEAAAAASAEAGFRPTARRHRQMEAASEREAELIAGHGDFRYAAYITVTVPAGDHERLNEVSKEITRAAGQSLMDITVEYGMQPEAFAYTLPLARGL